MYTRSYMQTHMTTARGKAAEHVRLFQAITCFPTLTSSDQELVNLICSQGQRGYGGDDALKIVLNTFSQSAGASHSLACT